MVVAIDSGVDFNHPSLVGQFWTNPGEIAILVGFYQLQPAYRLAIDLAVDVKVVGGEFEIMRVRVCETDRGNAVSTRRKRPLRACLRAHQRVAQE